MKIQLKRSNVLVGSDAKAPTSAQMEFGELAINYKGSDPVIFLKVDDATAGPANDGIIRIAGADSTGTGTGDITLSGGTGISGGGTFELDQTSDQTLTLNLDAATTSVIGGLTEPSTNGNFVRNNNSGTFSWEVVDYDTSGSTSAIAGNLTVGGTLAVTSTITGNVTGNLTGNVTGDVVGNVTGNVSGNAGTANLASTFTVTANNTTDETVYPIFVDGATGSQGAESDTGLSYNPSTGLLTTTAVAANLTGNVTGNLTGNAATASLSTEFTVTANNSTNETVYPVFVDGNSGAQGAEADTGLNYNPSTGRLTTTSVNAALTGNVTGNVTGNLTGDVTGNADTSTLATTVTVTTNNNNDETVYPLFADGVTGAQGAEADSGLYYNPSTGVLTTSIVAANLTGNVTGNLTGNVTGNLTGDVTGNVTGNADTSTLASTVTVLANNSTNETVYPLFVDGATGAQTVESDTDLTYNPNTGLITTTTVAANLITTSGNLLVTPATFITEFRGGGSTEGQIKLNCSANSHGQTIRPQPHSAGVTNTLTLPAGGNQELVGTTATQTLTNKTISGTFTGNINGNVTGNVTGNLTGDVTGNADTSTLASTFTVTANNSTNETCYLLFADGATGPQGAETDTALNYNPGTDALVLGGTFRATNLTDGTITKTMTDVLAGGAITIQNQGTSLPTAAETLNFTGEAVTTTGNGTTKTITISGGASVTNGANPPSSPEEGDLWYETDGGRGYVYYNDGDSSQWVEFSPSWNGGVSDSSITPAKLSTGGPSWNTSGLLSSYAFHATANVTPTSGSGVEIFKASSTSGQISAFNRDSSAWMDFIIKGNTQQFHANGSERMRIDSSGNVGIGTTSPNNYTGYATLTLNDTVGGEVDFESNGTLLGNIYSSSVTGDFHIDARGSSTDLVLKTNAAERMRIDSSGKVGIGTSSPSVSYGNGLHIAGSSAGLKLQNTNNTDWAYIEYADESNTTKFIQGYRDANGVYGIRPGTSLNADPGLSLDSSGNVGIGTSSPRRNFHVHNTASATTGLMLTNANTGAADDSQGFQLKVGSDSHAEIAQMENSNIRIFTNANERMRIDSSGRLLVGTTNARTDFFGSLTANLQVEGSTFAAYSCYATNGNGAFIFGRDNAVSGSTIGNISWQADDGTDEVEAARISCAVDGTPGSNDMPGRLVFSTTADGGSVPTERMRIDSSGNVGIGTTSPTSNNGTNLNINHATSSTLHLTTGNSGSNNSDGFHIINSSGIAYLWNREATDTVLGTNNTERMRIDSSGKVGIGDTSPDRKLQIVHSTDALMRLGRSDATSHGSTDVEIKFAKNYYSNAVFEAASHRFEIQGAEKMRIDSSGNVGIGTTSPTSQYGTNLNINHATSSTLHLTTGNSGSNNSDGFHIINSSGIAYLWNREATDTVLATNNTERMRIDSSGHLLVGTTTKGFNNVADQFTIANSSHCGMTIRSGSTSAGSIYFADGTSGAAEYGGYIDYSHSEQRLRFGTGSGSERMRITSSGQIFMNCTSQVGGGYIQHIKMNSGTGGIAIQNYGSSNIAILFRNSAGNATVGSISTGNSSTAYNTSSDYRLKENVVDITGAISRVKQLSPKRFNFIADNTTIVDGFIAHEAQEVVPEAVTGEKDGEEMQGIDQAKLVPLLTAALQEAITKIEALETKVLNLEGGTN